MKATKARLDGQLMDLDKDIDAVATKSDEVIRRHSAVIEVVKAGIKEMEEAVRELEGNGEDHSDEEGADKSNIATFQSGSDKTLSTG
jgi:hypothetical protein